MEQYIGLDVSLKETSLCVYQTGTTLAVADTILWPAARGSGVMASASPDDDGFKTWAALAGR